VPFGETEFLAQSRPFTARELDEFPPSHVASKKDHALPNLQSPAAGAA